MRIIVVLFTCLLLAGCQSLTQTAAKSLVSQLQSASATETVYPSAKAQNSQLSQHPPQVDLSQYQSVQSPIGRPHQRPDIAIAVAASGGGYRAANLTAGVLMGLEQITNPNLKGNLLEEVDYFSTVSGGGLGVGYYLASQFHFMQLHGNDPFAAQFSFTNTMNQLPAHNVLNKDFNGELFFTNDRGAVFEKDLANSILQTDQGTLTLGDIFIPASGNPAQVKLPYWVTNSTIYQNAAFLPFTPDVLAKYKVDSYEHDKKIYSVDNNYFAIPVSVGAAASASFPFALTPVTLGSSGCQDGQCYLQLLDGGLSDNLGIYTALNLLRQDKAKIKILIVIDAYSGTEQPFSKEKTVPESSTLFWRVLDMSTDASRQQEKANLNGITRAELCRRGTSNVLVIYLDLEHYKKAQQISTGFFISPQQQRLLLAVGQDLVLENPQIFQQLKAMLDGDNAIGRCPSGH